MANNFGFILQLSEISPFESYRSFMNACGFECRDFIRDMKQCGVNCAGVEHCHKFIHVDKAMASSHRQFFKCLSM